MVKNSIFLSNFQSKFSDFLKIFLTIWIFHPNARKINSGHLTFLKNKLKCSFCIFIKICCTFSKILCCLGGGGLCPRTPYETDTPKVFPPNRNPGGAAGPIARKLFNVPSMNSKLWKSIPDHLNWHFSLSWTQCNWGLLMVICYSRFIGLIFHWVEQHTITRCIWIKCRLRTCFILVALIF